MASRSKGVRRWVEILGGAVAGGLVTIIGQKITSPSPLPVAIVTPSPDRFAKTNPAHTIQISTSVAKVDSAFSSNRYTAKPGEIVSVLFSYKTVSNKALINVTIEMDSPAGAEVVPGSVLWVDANNPDGTPIVDGALTSEGLNVGTIDPGGGGYIRYRIRTALTDDCTDHTAMLQGRLVAQGLKLFYSNKAFVDYIGCSSS